MHSERNCSSFQTHFLLGSKLRVCWYTSFSLTVLSMGHNGLSFLSLAENMVESICFGGQLIYLYRYIYSIMVALIIFNWPLRYPFSSLPLFSLHPCINVFFRNIIAAKANLHIMCEILFGMYLTGTLDLTLKPSH